MDGLTIETVREHIYASFYLLPNISPENTEKLWDKLMQYRFIHSLNDLRRGRFIRWIPVHARNSEYKLSYGGMVIDVEITDECPMILCKTPIGKMVKFDFNQNLVYQKLTAEEKLIITLAADLPNSSF